MHGFKILMTDTSFIALNNMRDRFPFTLNLNGMHCVDSFPFYFEPNRISFDSKSKGNLLPRIYSAIVSKNFETMSNCKPCSFSFDFERNGIPFASKFKVKEST